MTAGPLLTRAEVAARLMMSERTFRQRLAVAMAASPFLRPIRAGRKMLFTERDYHRVREGLGLPSLLPVSAPSPAPSLPAYWARVFARTRRGATKRRIAYSLTEADALAIVGRASGQCEVSGLPFDHTPVGSAGWMPYAPSVDRVDAAGTYEASNCRLVSCAVNLALGSWGDDVLLRIARGIVKRNGPPDA